MTTDAQKRATARYHANNTRLVNVRLNVRTDADILERLGSVPNKQGYIKSLIRADIADRK